MFFIDFPDVIDLNGSNNDDAAAFTMGAYGKTYVYVRHMMWWHSLTRRFLGPSSTQIWRLHHFSNENRVF